MSMYLITPGYHDYTHFINEKLRPSDITEALRDKGRVVDLRGTEVKHQTWREVSDV